MGKGEESRRGRIRRAKVKAKKKGGKSAAQPRFFFTVGLLLSLSLFALSLLSLFDLGTVYLSNLGSRF